MTRADDPHAAHLPALYDELRRLAAANLAREPDGHTLDATALVHEAYLRLGERQVFATRTDFFRAAAGAMRRVLIDHARTKRADKRGGQRLRVELPDVPDGLRDPDLVDLDDALTELEHHDPVAAELVTLRYFSGLSHAEAAEALGLTRRQADGVWAVARAWLFRRLRAE
jgi:RNA polymerase sigma factor (TIGR02999 family)